MARSKWDAIRLYRELSMEQLVSLQQSLTSDPANQQDSTKLLWLYTPETRRKLDAIARAITWHIADKR